MRKRKTKPALLVSEIDVNRLIASLLAFALTSAAAEPRNLGEGDEISFKREVLAVLQKEGCSAGKCHGSFAGRGGLQLSLFASDPALDYRSLAQEAFGRRVSPSSPENSLMLLKPTAEIPHEGGAQLEVGSPSYEILRRWIAEGLDDSAEDKEEVVRLEISPSQIVIQSGETAQLKVVAHWSDGVAQDVSDWAIYECREERIATVSESGEVTATGPGRAAITVGYLGRVVTVPVSAPFGKEPELADFEPKNFIDELIAEEWKRMVLEPAPKADDYEFLRRVFVDLTGSLPTPDEIRTFAADTDPDKRAKIVDALLERPEFVDFWTLKYGDLFRVHRRFLGEKGMWTFHSWLKQAVAENRPLDELTRQLLTARGDLYANGAVGFYFVDNKPEEFAETTAQVFLGLRMQCAKCHDHPMEAWRQEDYHGLANFFTKIVKKDNGDAGRFGGARLIKTSLTTPKEMRPVMALDPHAFGEAVVTKVEGDVRETLANWITDAENPFFARNWANRHWAWLMGRGLVEPVDDLRPSNPATMPALFEALAEEFKKSGHDSRDLIRTICNSAVYQLSSETSPTRDEEAKFHTHHPHRRLSAQVLADAIDSATGIPTEYEGLPPGTRATQLPDPAIRSASLNLFGRSLRASPCECASSNELDLAQALYFLNSADIQSKVAHSKSRVQQLLADGADDETIFDELFLRTLSRPPSEAEIRVLRDQVAAASSREEAMQDLLWSLLNSSRFVFRH